MRSIRAAMASSGLLFAGIVDAQYAVPKGPVGPVTMAPTVEITVGAGGSVRWPAGNCEAGPGSLPGTCKAVVATGKPVMFQAVAAAGKAFAGWTGACKGQGPRCQIVPSQQTTTIAAGFDTAVAAAPPTPGKPVYFSVTLPAYGGAVQGAAFGTVQLDCAKRVSGKNAGKCSTQVPIGTEVMLVATPEVGAAFVGWESKMPGCAGKTCKFTMAKDPTMYDGSVGVVARFTPPPYVTLTFGPPKPPAPLGSSDPYAGFGGDWYIMVDGGSFVCEVEKTPAGNICGMKLKPGRVIKVTAMMTGSSYSFAPKPTPAEGTMWQGACAGTVGTTCTLTMDGDKNVVVKSKP